jgi:hypothetical protein
MCGGEIKADIHSMRLALNDAASQCKVKQCPRIREICVGLKPAIINQSAAAMRR